MTDHDTEGTLSDAMRDTTPAAIMRQRGQALIDNPNDATYSVALSTLRGREAIASTERYMVDRYVREGQAWREQHPDDFEEYSGWADTVREHVRWRVRVGRAMVKAAGEME